MLLTGKKPPISLHALTAGTLPPFLAPFSSLCLYNTRSFRYILRVYHSLHPPRTEMLTAPSFSISAVLKFSLDA